MDRGELSRRELLAAGVAVGATLAVEPAAQAAVRPKRIVRRIDFSNMPDARGWGAGWRTTGVANLRRERARGVLEAGSDVFPNDPRPVVFAVDSRIRDGEVAATVVEVGSAVGVVLRRRSPRRYYTAVYDTGARSFRILRRDGSRLDELARTDVPSAEPPLTLRLEAIGGVPTTLRAELTDAGGLTVTAEARDAFVPLAGAGDPGVLALAETLFPSDPNPVVPALGNLHLLPWAVQEGQAFMATPVGQGVVEEIRRRSTAAFSEIVVSALRPAATTPPAVVAATTGRPIPGGAVLHVATDLPARTEIELSYSRDFSRARTVRVGRTGPFDAATRAVSGLRPGRRVYWRPIVRRAGTRRRGPVRSFRVAPGAGSARRFRIAVLACGAQFGPIFGHIADARPDVVIWQGDLNYPDTHGPLSQTVSGYAGIWRDFLANPRFTPILRDAAFAAQRDDHDFGVQDANSTTIPKFPWGVEPWNALMGRREYYRFAAGAAEVWVLDQRTYKSDPESEDGSGKSLLGLRQRRWLLESLARSPARFKLICSPCTLFMKANSRDGNWSNDFEAERDLLLDQIDRRVNGTTLFLTGDTHLTGVYDADGRFEARAAPVGIPKPNDITLLDPFAADELRDRPGVVYAGDECHFTLLEVGRDVLDLKLVREDGAVPYSRRFRTSRAARTRAR